MESFNGILEKTESLNLKIWDSGMLFVSDNVD